MRRIIVRVESKEQQRRLNGKAPANWNRKQKQGHCDTHRKVFVRKRAESRVVGPLTIRDSSLQSTPKQWSLVRTPLGSNQASAKACPSATPLWAERLRSEEFFASLLKNAPSAIGSRTLKKIGQFICFADQDDIISLSICGLWEQLLKVGAIVGVASLSANHSYIYFNSWKRVYCYLRAIAYREIIGVQRSKRLEASMRTDSNDELEKILVADVSDVNQIKARPHEDWVRVFGSFSSIQQKAFLELWLSGQSMTDIESTLNLSRGRSRRLRVTILDRFREFKTPGQLLEAMES